MIPGPKIDPKLCNTIVQYNFNNHKKFGYTLFTKLHGPGTNTNIQIFSTPKIVRKSLCAELSDFPLHVSLRVHGHHTGYDALMDSGH